MVQRVNLDAMIQREDFAREATEGSASEMIRELKVTDLVPDHPIRRQLRKPEFQRETNHWKPEQVVRLLTSFIDGDVIPSIILWRTTNYIFVIDGAHRLSALCAWISDDYGQGVLSNAFYAGEISREQRRIAERVRNAVNSAIGSYADLNALIGKSVSGQAGKRAGGMSTRPIVVQQVYGTPKVAEDSFFAINTQGTPLDDTEKLLIENRRKPIAIAARAIIRAGRGHAYWSNFNQQNQVVITDTASELYRIIFEPQITTPLKTLDVPHAGPASPVEALAMLIDFLIVCNSSLPGDLDNVAAYPNDETGEQTIDILRAGLRVANRITGNSAESLGLHPAVYFMNEQGKHSRFLFLGMVATISDKLRNNDSAWFRKFTEARSVIEKFLIEHKSLIGIVLQNLNKTARTRRMRDMFNFMVKNFSDGRTIDADTVVAQLGLSHRIYDVTTTARSPDFSEETRSAFFLSRADCEGVDLSYLRRSIGYC